MNNINMNIIKYIGDQRYSRAEQLQSEDKK